jgi:serine protease Do
MAEMDGVTLMSTRTTHAPSAEGRTVDLALHRSPRAGRVFAGTALVLALAIGGCQQAPVSIVKPAEAAAPANAALPASPAPVPATFDVADLAERVKPMVVNITTTHRIAARGEAADPFELFFGPRFGGRAPAPDRAQKQTALGTGFLIDQEGYVVTNAHVVDEADEVRVRLSDERELDADVVGRDPKLDLALLKLRGASGLPPASLGSSEALRVGEHVLAVGNPFGLGHTVTLGIVSAKARTIGAGPYDDFIQTDASINPGNSGGPLFNGRGEVVGINTAIRAGANGIGFAIPIDALKDVLPQLRQKGYVERGRIGIQFQSLTDDMAKALQLDAPRGALVAEVEPNGPAARAGIQSGDVIVAVNGVPIVHAEELPRNVAKNVPGTEIAVTLQRGGQRRDVRAKLDALPDGDARPTRPGKADPSQPAPQSAGKLGLRISDAPGGGARVDGLLPGSDVDDVRAGDVVVEVNGVKIADTKGFQEQMTRLTPGSVALLKLKRGDVTRFAAVRVPSP